MLTATGRLSVVLLAFMCCVSAEAAALSSREFDRLARECAPSAAPSTLAAIAKVEGDFDPLAAYDDRTTDELLHLKDQTPARHSATDRLEAQHLVDVGLIQVSSRNVSKLGLTPDMTFQPCISLSTAARLLEKRSADDTLAAAKQLVPRQSISDSNTGDPARGITNGYRPKVELAARQTTAPLIEVPKEADETPTEEAWDIWELYERQRLVEEPSEPPTGRRETEREKSRSPCPSRTRMSGEPKC
ncbi:type IV secretion system lytic transglycosylase VirB1 [Bradyrhizobium sp. CCGUVB23]|uniref:type IV secretion system lytic transglycosylase VirB1 n=1 Tax=Bradyrhizobium sp. CCGUVB23 TaxID=2949630 RepID=UPI0020B373FC|nr:type IV secretion system lytic transglycosylase VirB1 [Bradyrhizobium sp. CCGUVB23]MCP3468669.1 type IV secretion system lytic transglycosylase VirB1 [Bradyrhizobium sp. CCGUVB23]